MNFNSRVMNNKTVLAKTQVDNSKTQKLEPVGLNKISEGNNNKAQPQGCFINASGHDAIVTIRTDDGALVARKCKSGESIDFNGEFVSVQYMN